MSRAGSRDIRTTQHSSGSQLRRAERRRWHELAHFLARQFEKGVEQAEVGQHRGRRGVDRVAARVAQEDEVRFEHHQLPAGTRQKVASAQPVRAGARAAALRRTGRSVHEQCVLGRTM